MASLGTDLRQARQHAGLSLEQVSARTKIRRVLLEAIERDDFLSLPGGVLTRGYLRAYAQEVGLSPDDIARRHKEEFGSDAPALSDAFRHRAEVSRLSSNADWSPVTSIAAVLIAAFVLWMYFNHRVQSGADAQVVGTAGRADSAERATDAAPAAAPDGAPASLIGSGARAGSPLTVEINPTAVVWVEARADGKRVLYALISPDERRVIEARDECLVRVGDAGAFRYLVNGVQGRQLGRSGEVRQLRITQANYPTFQQH